METFELHILGCGSALPTMRHLPTSQVIHVRNKLFMIDCGEGTQLQLRRSKLSFSKLNHIFISHLHGDHCFGLIGLISTFDMLGRTARLCIHSPHGLKSLMTPWLDFFCKNLGYEIEFMEFDTSEPTTIYEDRSITVETIPLNHRIPCCGFLFAEKPLPRHIKRDMIDFYQVPTYELNRIKNGADYTLPNGEVIPNERLTSAPTPSRRYAYCSDTAYHPAIVQQIRGVDLLFHEATFGHEALARARETFHTTATQAANIAQQAQVGKLIIGHFSARYDDETPLLKEAQEVFPNTSLARENDRIDIIPFHTPA